MNIRTLAVLVIVLSALNGFSQRGKDGAATFSTAGNIVNEYTTLTADAAAGSNTLTVALSSLNANSRFAAPLAPGDLVMIIQMQGATLNATLNGSTGSPNDSTWGAITNYNNSGNNELAEVLAVPNATTITLRCGLMNSYTASGRTQVIRIPRYSSITVNNGGEITSDSWDGAKGGVIAIEVEGSTIVNAGGRIDASGKGFRGGALTEDLATYGVHDISSTDPAFGAEKGEGLGGYKADYDLVGGRYGKGAAANGGGGGNAHNAGGGGGANGGNPALWNGHGNPDLSVASYATAYNREYPWKSTTTSSGGGKGGYSFSGANLDATVVGPTTSPGAPMTSWTGDYRRNNGGFGGRPLDYSTGRLFLGGGGGAGDQNSSTGGAGGNGGGIVYLAGYGSISGAGSIVSNGNSGVTATGNYVFGGPSVGKDGAGGGGAGGTIILNFTGPISGISATANGGAGGNQNIRYYTTVNEAEGPGGGGGGGYIAVSNGSIVQTASGGNNGTTNSASLTEFPSNGATRGGAGTTGQVVTNFTFTANGITICSGNTATLTAAINGTAPSGTGFEWYDAAAGGNLLGTGPSFTTPVLSATTTFYVGTCPGTYTIPVVVTVTSGLTVSVSANDSICPGGSAAISATATGAVTYSWAPSASLDDASAASPVASPASTTTYTITVSDGSGCTGTDSVTVVVHSSPAASAGADIQLCAGEDTTLTASGGVSYQWSPSAGLSSATVSNPVAAPSATTAYTVTVTDANGCTGTDDITITVKALPSADAGADTSVCDGGSVALSASAGSAYSWAPSSSLSASNVQNPAASPGATTSYTLTLTGANGCMNTDSVLVTVKPLPTPYAGADVTICNGASSSLLGTGGVSYSWQPAATLDDPSAANPIATPPSTTTYTVTVTGANNCTATDSVTVTVSSAMTVFAGNDTAICERASVQLNASGTGTYSWLPSAGLSDPSIANPVASPTVTTTYTLTVTSGSCQGTDSITVTINAPPMITGSADAMICGSQPATISATATGGASPVNLVWDNGLAGDGPHNVSPASTTVYHVYAIDAFSCISATDSIIIMVAPPLSVTAFSSVQSICSGGSATLSAAASGGNGSYTYSWSPVLPGGSLNVSPAVTTTYTVTVTDNCGSAPASATVTIAVGAAPTVTIIADQTSGCAPLCVAFDIQSTGSCATVAWDFGSGNVSSLQQPSHCFIDSGSYSAIVTCTDAGGCTGSDTLDIDVSGLPSAAFTASSEVIILDRANPQTVCFTDASAGAASWDWDFDHNLSFSTLQNPCYTYPDTGTYCVSLTVTNTAGCSDTIRRCLQVLERVSYKVANIFTPNGDGVNDRFTLSALGVKNISCTIYNRWGVKVHEWSDPSGTWDGRTTSGQEAEAGTYYFIATIATPTGDVIERGAVQLLR